MKKLFLITALTVTLIGCKKQADTFQNPLSNEMTGQSASIGTATLETGIYGSMTLTSDRAGDKRYLKYSLKGLQPNKMYYLISIDGNTVATNLYFAGIYNVPSGSRGTASGTATFLTATDLANNDCSSTCFKTLRLVNGGSITSPTNTEYFIGLSDWSNESYLDLITVTSPGCDDADATSVTPCISYAPLSAISVPTNIKFTRRL